MYTPKQEVKDTASRISLYAEQLQSKVMANWFKRVVDDTGDIEVQATAAEAQELPREIAQLKKESDIKENDIMVQCDECQTVTKKLKRKRLLTKDKTFENFQKVTEDDWAIGLIPKIEVQNRNIWEAPQDHDVVLPCNSNFKNVNGLVETAINKLGGKDGLKKQGKQKGEVAIMIHSLGFPDNDGNGSE
ncbi:hypothetical protein JTB14_008593 [Gonioctena quinquepunctata]|nr:hypothetical protein JTB14_008593 [Gonioctena quinquepunctata]